MLKRSNKVAAGGPISESDQIRMIKSGAGAARPRKSGPFRDQNEKVRPAEARLRLLTCEAPAWNVAPPPSDIDMPRPMSD